jgi:hypothetical protein
MYVFLLLQIVLYTSNQKKKREVLVFINLFHISSYNVFKVNGDQTTERNEEESHSMEVLPKDPTRNSDHPDSSTL